MGRTGKEIEESLDDLGACCFFFWLVVREVERRSLDQSVAEDSPALQRPR
jgi:hypothetical protein